MVTNSLQAVPCHSDVICRGRRIQNGVSCNVLVNRHALNRCENRCFFIAVGQRQRDRAFGRIARGIGRNDREIVARLRLVIQAGRRIDLARCRVDLEGGVIINSLQAVGHRAGVRRRGGRVDQRPGNRRGLRNRRIRRRKGRRVFVGVCHRSGDRLRGGVRSRVRRNYREAVGCLGSLVIERRHKRHFTCVRVNREVGRIPSAIQAVGHTTRHVREIVRNGRIHDRTRHVLGNRGASARSARCDRRRGVVEVVDRERDLFLGRVVRRIPCDNCEAVARLRLIVGLSRGLQRDRTCGPINVEGCMVTNSLQAVPCHSDVICRGRRIQNGVSCNVLVNRHALNRCENRCRHINRQSLSITDS